MVRGVGCIILVELQHNMEIPGEQAIKLNRHQRRHLGKINNARIPGITRPEISEKRQIKKGKVKFTWQEKK